MRRNVCWLLSLSAAALPDPADWIITGRYVVTMDASRQVIEDGAVAIRGERIVGVGRRAAIDRQFQAARRLDRPQDLVAPGLINTHTHAPMTLMRGVADDLRLQDWLEKFIFPVEAKMVSAEFVRWGTRLACLEMLLGGTTTYADMYYFEEVIAEATEAAGMRGVLGQTIIRFPVPDAKTPDEGLQRTESFLERYRGHPLITAAVAPHALYTNADETLRKARSLANRYGAPLLVHLSETKQENDDMAAARGASPTKVLDLLGIWNGRSLAAHAVWASDNDLRILKERGAGIAHCPSSNMKLASGVAPVVKMLSMDLAVGLGTDGPAGSNNDLNLLEEIDLAAKLQKVTTGDPRALPAREAVEMATIRGARALGMQKEIGSLEPGKRADLIVVGLGRPNSAPLFDPVSHLAFAVKASDVADVFVNGRAVVRDGQPLTLDRAAILAKAAEYGARIRALRP